MNVSQVVNSQETLNKLVGFELPIGIAHKLSKTLKEVESVLELFDTKRKALFDKLGKESDDGMIIPEDNVAEYNETIQTILDEEVEVDFSLVKAEDLGDIKLSVKDLNSLDWLIEF